MRVETITVFIVYLLGMVAIGVWMYRRTNTTTDYFLGGRSLNSWVTALSAQASDMSGWLLLGLPGLIYATGVNGMWMAIGLAVGTYLNWQFIAKRLRRYTEVNQSITIPDYLDNRFKDQSKALRIVSALTILVFFLFYTASGMVASAVLFQETFHIDYNVALFIGAVVVVSYTFLGGFLAVSLTDFVQGSLMFLSLIFVPVALINMLGGVSEAMTAVSQVNPDLLNMTKIVNLDESGSWISQTVSFSVIGTVSLVAWGLGYFGQPHILVRFMGIRSASEIPKARFIGVIWVVLSLLGAGFVGLLGIPYFDVPLDNPETVLISLAQMLFNPWITGIVLAAIFSAIMSTIDSQLLVCSSAIAEDFYRPFFRKNASEAELVWVSRITVLAVAIVAVILAMSGGSVLDLVSYAWAGFGAAFGPVVLLSLFWKRMTRNGALSGIVVGGVTVLLWKHVPALSGTGLYELVPGFVLGLLAITIFSLIDKAPSRAIQDEYDKATRPLPRETA